MTGIGVESLAREFITAVSAHRFRFSDEKQLQDGIEVVLDGSDIPFAREYRLAAGKVPDFWLADRLAVEVKVGGSLSAATRQVAKYADHPAVRGVVLVTARVMLDRMPAELCGKPVWSVVVPSAFA